MFLKVKEKRKVNGIAMPWEKKEIRKKCGMHGDRERIGPMGERQCGGARTICRCLHRHFIQGAFNFMLHLLFFPMRERHPFI